MIKKIIIFTLILVLSIISVVINKFYIILIANGIFSIIYYLKTKDEKFFMKILLMLYIVSIFYFMITNRNFNRKIVLGGAYFKSIVNYLNSNFNIVPFRTIVNFIKHMYEFEEFPSVNDAFLNIIGNIICLMPAVFFYVYFRRKDKHKIIYFLLTTSLIIEFLQIITLSGSFDIDDIILNFSGSYFFYLLFQNDIKRIAENGLNFKVLISNSLIKITLVIFLISLILLIYFQCKNKEKEYWEKYYNFRIILLKETTCKSSKEYIFYEDELYTYAFECEEIINSIISIYGKRYTLYDYLNKKTMYPISISKVEELGLKDIRKEKWDKLAVCPFSFEAINYHLDNKQIVELVPAEDVIVNREECRAFFIIPKSEGTTNAIFEGDFGIQEYEISVDANNEIKYKKKDSNE